MQTTTVYVTKNDYDYGCTRIPLGGAFICGACGHGRLGENPSEGDQCPRCHAEVTSANRRGDA